MTVEDFWPILRDGVRARRASATFGLRLDGRLDSAAQQLFELFKPLLDLGRTSDGWVIAQLGQSLDGCVATRSGDSSFINGSESLLHLHRLRAVCDAVIVGAGTAAVDNPQLTTRRVPGPNPIRVLLDPNLRLSEHVIAARAFNDGQAPTLWLCDARWRDRAVAQVGADRVLAVDDLMRDDTTLHLANAVTALRSRGLTRLFVEGGGVTVSRFLAQGCLDRLHLAVAPVIIGDGRRGLQFTGPARLMDCPRPPCNVYPMGPDHLWDLDLRAST